ncbi:hypothetical protein N7478_003837 [Penicillium angulare]|uniref:uncharacterized protein n=1 Tax=Penicillium angulare TaxID=116970 RepID=UPI0025422AAC|nr:uncharacterized protein N7478_003837 [Penicillium angulare]KAJ5288151.1 hypothetical protein N7478_003837 [Penicillium angulare]
MVGFNQATSAVISVLCTLSASAYAGATGTAPALPAATVFDNANGVVGGVHRPAKHSPRSRVAVYVMHAESDYMSFSACTQLAERGFTVFCANNAADKTGPMSDIYFEDEILQVDVGMQYLRNLTGIDKVVLFGHSGGGAMMAAYQNIAENGASACSGEEKIHKCGSALDGMHPADGIILIDANYGLGSMPLLSLNPALTGPHGSTINESLNLFNPANGFVNGSISNYTSDFKQLYQAGVVKRNNDVIEYAKGRLAAIENGTAGMTDDEQFYVNDMAYGVTSNKFFAQDTRYLAHTTHAWPLLHKGGNITVQRVPSVRVPTNFASVANQYINGALKTTIRRFLSTFAIHATEDFDILADGFKGIDFDSNHFSPSSSIKGVKVPLLNMGMTGHWEYLNAEKIHMNAPGNDTAIAFVEGATHLIYTCVACESYPGEFGNTMTTTYDFMASWLAKEGRFIHS